MENTIKIHPSDNVGVIVQAQGDVPPGHKIALIDSSFAEDLMMFRV